MQYIAFDSHNRYTQASVISTTGTIQLETRIAHESGAVAAFLVECEPGSPVAAESIGNWYWIVDEIENPEWFPASFIPGRRR